MSISAIPEVLTRWKRQEENFLVELKNLYPIYPDWLYNALPYAYVCCGLFFWLLLPDFFGLLSGLIMLSTAGVVWLLRYRYSREFAQSQHHIELPADWSSDDLPVGGIVQISWGKYLECGHPVIDGQHRRLFGLANEAVESLLAKRSKAQEERLLEKLLTHMAQHFATEESVFASKKDPDFQLHKEQHLALLAQAASLRERYHNDQVATRELVNFMVDTVILNHIVKEDLSSLGAAAR
jgi:hemerythrin-like metal-binding protein